MFYLKLKNRSLVPDPRRAIVLWTSKTLKLKKEIIADQLMNIASLIMHLCHITISPLLTKRLHHEALPMAGGSSQVTNECMVHQVSSLWNTPNQKSIKTFKVPQLASPDGWMPLVLWTTLFNWHSSIRYICPTAIFLRCFTGNLRVYVY